MSNWYDVLGVERDASAEEITEAWRTSIAGLTPTDPTFRVFNQAYEVLADPKKRSAHDAELAAEADTAEAEESDDPGEPEEPAESDEPEEPAESDEPEGLAESEEAPAAKPKALTSRGISVTAMAVIAVVVWVLVAVIVWRGPLFGPSEGEIQDAREDAQVVAGQAAEALFSYDYTKLEADAARARDYLTGEQLDEYNQLFEGIIQSNAVETETKVKTNVLDTAVASTGSGEGAVDEVDVLVLFNQISSNKATQSREARNYVTVRMVESEGDWLVEEVTGPSTKGVGGPQPSPAPSPSGSAKPSPRASE